MWSNDRSFDKRVVPLTQVKVHMSTHLNHQWSLIPKIKRQTWERVSNDKGEIKLEGHKISFFNREQIHLQIPSDNFFTAFYFINFVLKESKSHHLNVVGVIIGGGGGLLFG